MSTQPKVYQDLNEMVDLVLKWLEVYSKPTETEMAALWEARARVVEIRAYMAGRPTDLSSVDDLGWVKTPKSLYESRTLQQQYQDLRRH